MNYDLKIIDDYIKSIDFYNFQDFCDRLLLTLFPDDYTPVRAGGRNGDMKNDGYCYLSRIFFQAHATRGENSNRTKKKIKEDLIGCLEKWSEVKEFVYITNDTLIGDVENFVDQLRLEFPQIIIRTWSQKILIEKIRGLKVSDVERIIDRKIIPEKSVTYKDTFTTKYLVTDNFNFIKEISNLELKNFPFDNALILDNEILRFTRELLKNQDYRNEELIKRIKIKAENYRQVYPDAKIFANADNEYQWKYHERTPKLDEIKNTVKNDCITDYLITNKISSDKIAKIYTCYEGECAGDGDFIESYLLRPLWAQYLIVKNISKSAIKLDAVDVLKTSGVLHHQKEALELANVKLPNFEIEPNQNIILPIGVFLDDFGKSEKINVINVSNSHTSEQYQELNFGKILKSTNIEFIGPSIVPLSISYNNENTKIHPFDFDNIYWIERYWGYGSCPHMFFSYPDGSKYQGEIFKTTPNQINTEKITIPEKVFEIIIAELEKEITYINYISLNGKVLITNITLREGQYLSCKVSPNDVIRIEGYYQILSESYISLPRMQKNRIVEKFKQNFGEPRPREAAPRASYFKPSSVR